jgi:putative acetyltransferase
VAELREHCARSNLPGVEITIDNPCQPDIMALLAASDAYMATLYPAESNHMLDVASLQRPQVTFIVARANGQAVGCGALVSSGESWAEIKRMFVAPAARGQKLGRRLLQKLESIAIDAGVTLLRLETGVKQPEALLLYRSAGFSETGPFGHYGPDPFSVFMEKPLTAGDQTGAIR